MNCKFCKAEMADLIKGKGEHPNWYCYHCKGHYWKGVWYTAKEWDAWLEEDEPGAMTEKELKAKAKFKAQLKLGKNYTGRVMLFYELTHYFDENMIEIGYTSTLGDKPTIFKNGRIWDDSFFKDYRIVDLATLSEV